MKKVYFIMEKTLAERINVLNTPTSKNREKAVMAGLTKKNEINNQHEQKL